MRWNEIYVYIYLFFGWFYNFSMEKDWYVNRVFINGLLFFFYFNILYFCFFSLGVVLLIFFNDWLFYSFFVIVEVLGLCLMFFNCINEFNKFN